MLKIGLCAFGQKLRQVAWFQQPSIEVPGVLEYVDTCRFWKQSIVWTNGDRIVLQCQIQRPVSVPIWKQSMALSLSVSHSRVMLRTYDNQCATMPVHCHWYLVRSKVLW